MSMTVITLKSVSETDRLTWVERISKISHHRKRLRLDQADDPPTAEATTIQMESGHILQEDISSEPIAQHDSIDLDQHQRFHEIFAKKHDEVALLAKYKMGNLPFNILESALLTHIVKEKLVEIKGSCVNWSTVFKSQVASDWISAHLYHRNLATITQHWCEICLSDELKQEVEQYLESWKDFNPIEWKPDSSKNFDYLATKRNLMWIWISQIEISRNSSPIVDDETDKQSRLASSEHDQRAQKIYSAKGRPAFTLHQRALLVLLVKKNLVRLQNGWPLWYTMYDRSETAEWAKHILGKFTMADIHECFCDMRRERLELAVDFVERNADVDPCNWMLKKVNATKEAPAPATACASFISLKKDHNRLDGRRKWTVRESAVLLWFLKEGLIQTNSQGKYNWEILQSEKTLWIYENFLGRYNAGDFRNHFRTWSRYGSNTRKAEAEAYLEKFGSPLNWNSDAVKNDDERCIENDDNFKSKPESHFDDEPQSSFLVSAEGIVENITSATTLEETMAIPVPSNNRFSIFANALMRTCAGDPKFNEANLKEAMSRVICSIAYEPSINWTIAKLKSKLHSDCELRSTTMLLIIGWMEAIGVLVKSPTDPNAFCLAVSKVDAQAILRSYMSE